MHFFLREKLAIISIGLKIERVKGVTKTMYLLLDLQIVPTVLNGTYVFCQDTGNISQKAQNF